jgi:hypothetical protein
VEKGAIQPVTGNCASDALHTSPSNMAVAGSRCREPEQLWRLVLSHSRWGETGRREPQRVAILTSPLSEPTGFYLTVDCQSGGCGGERTFAMSLLQRARRRAAAYAVFGRLRRPSAHRLAGDRANPQCEGQAAAGDRCWGRRRGRVDFAA